MADETTVQHDSGGPSEEAIAAAEEAAEAETRAEQESADREESSKIDAFLRSRGIPGYSGGEGDDDEGGDEGEDDEGELETAEEDEGGEAYSEQQLMDRELAILTAALDEIDGGRQAEPQLSDAERGFLKRQEAREVRRYQEENQQLKSYVNALLSAVQRGTPQPGAQTPAAGPTGEGQEGGEGEGPDLFQDPKGFLDHYFQTQVRPLQERIAQFEAAERTRTVRQHVGQLEQRWEQEHPGYRDRLAAYRRAFVAELQYFGKSLQEAEKALINNERQLLEVAIENNVNPAELLDRSAQRWIAGSPGNGVAPTAQQQLQPANGKAPRRSKFDRARQAAQSAAAETLSDGSGGVDGNEVTAETLLASGASPDQVHHVLSQPGGRQNFLQLMRELERGGAG